MELLDVVKDAFTSFWRGFTTPWWVEITTEQPRCIYYFGPFQTSVEARSAQTGYIEDLENEEAQGIQVVIKRCKPEVLTIFNEDAE